MTMNRTVFAAALFGVALSLLSGCGQLGQVNWRAEPTKDFPLVWGQSAPTPVPAAEKAPVVKAPVHRPKLAVMEIEDKSGKVAPTALEHASDYLRGNLTAAHSFIVIEKGRQAEALKNMVREQKAESYQACYAQSCQIPLGQALAADTILRTTISSLGSQCTLSGELIDLAKEAATGGGIAKFDCTEDGLSKAIEALVPQLSESPGA